MNKILLIGFLCLCAISTNVLGQRGIKIHTQFGLSDVGFDTWTATNGDLTFALSVPLGAVVEFGAYGTWGLGSKYYSDGFDVYEFENSITEIGVLMRYNVFRAGKFNMYLQNTISNITVNNEDSDVLQSVSTPDVIYVKSSTVGFGVGAGMLYKLSPNVSLNIFEFSLTFLTQDVITIDRNLYKNYKVGLLFQLNKAK